MLRKIKVSNLSVIFDNFWRQFTQLQCKKLIFFKCSLQSMTSEACYKLDDLYMSISMNFPNASKRSDETFHLKRQLTYTLTFSEKLNGQYDLIVVRTHYPYVPLSACPFHLPAMQGVKFAEVTLTHDNVTHQGVTFVAKNCTALNINFDETSTMLSQKDRQMKLHFRKAKHSQLLLLSHDPTTLLGKVKF